MKVVPVVLRPVKACVVPSLDSCISTINSGISDSITTLSISTEQITVALDPTAGLSSTLVIVTEEGDGTKRE